MAALALLSFNVAALGAVTLEPHGDFYIYGEQNEKLAKTIGLKEAELSEYCKENNIVFLAVNSDNSKQIRVDCFETDFANSVVNISALSNDKITELIPNITGLDDVRGDIVEKKGQKFIKTELKSEDSGGGYLLTQYITIANKKNYILSFYTNENVDDEYIEKTFESYQSSDFLNDEGTSRQGWHYVILAATVIFALAAVAIAISVIRDIKKDKSQDTNDIED